MRDPLDGFADRTIRNEEVVEFLTGLPEKGVDPKVVQGVFDRHLWNRRGVIDDEELKRELREAGR